MTANAPSAPPIAVVLADSHALFRDGLRTFLVASGIEVPAVATNSFQALEAARTARCSVAVIDLHLEGLGGIETSRRLAEERPDLPIILLAISRFDSELQEAIRSGASGYLFKGEDPEVVLRTIVAAGRGTPILSAELARWLLRVFGSPAGGAAAVDRGLTLTPEESELLSAIEGSSRPPVGGTALGRSILAKLHRLHRKRGGAPPPPSG
jgi:DNA-binding NarL/FixJ family response regulator